MNASRFDPELGYVPLIPEPFWEKRHWWSRMRPVCIWCQARLKNRDEWKSHYVLKHLEEEEAR